MNGYDIPNDGKSHVNYSTLKRCTSPSSIISAIEELKGLRKSFDGETVQIGKIRHEQWQRESEHTGRTPKDFKDFYDQPVDFVEQSFSVEIFKDVMLHFRPDAVSLMDGAVIDYKKVVKGAYQFHNDWQLKVYAFGLQLLGYRVSKLVHLCEVWNRNTDQPKIIGYQSLERQITLADMALTKQWIRIRANYFVQATKILT